MLLLLGFTLGILVSNLLSLFCYEVDSKTRRNKKVRKDALNKWKTKN